MALVECKECKHQVSTKAKTCPNCGAKVSGRLGCLWPFLIIMTILYLTSLPGRVGHEATDTQESSQNTSEINSNQLSQPAIEAWSYNESNDSISNGVIKTAEIISSDKIELNFPYTGGTKGIITIRKHPRWGTDVMISISNGQMLCGYRNCEVTVSFDNAKSKIFSAIEPADHSNKMVFIKDAKGFIKQLKGSKKTLVEIAFYQNGSYAFEFNTAGLKF